MAFDVAESEKYIKTLGASCAGQRLRLVRLTGTLITQAGIAMAIVVFAIVRAAMLAAAWPESVSAASTGFWIDIVLEAFALVLFMSMAFFHFKSRLLHERLLDLALESREIFGQVTAAHVMHVTQGANVETNSAAANS